MAITGVVVVQHRRLVFYGRFPIADSVSFDGRDGVKLRNIKMLEGHSGVLDGLFEGHRGVDWTEDHLLQTRMDASVVAVLHDRCYKYVSQGVLLDNRSFYHKTGRKIHYDDSRHGDGYSGDGWAGMSNGSAGNLYVLDMFSVVSQDTSAVIRFSGSSHVYWLEK